MQSRSHWADPSAWVKAQEMRLARLTKWKLHAESGNSAPRAPKWQAQKPRDCHFRNYRSTRCRCKKGLRRHCSHGESLKTVTARHLSRWLLAQWRRPIALAAAAEHVYTGEDEAHFQLIEFASSCAGAHAWLDYYLEIEDALLLLLGSCEYGGRRLNHIRMIQSHFECLLRRRMQQLQPIWVRKALVSFRLSLLPRPRIAIRSIPQSAWKIISQSIWKIVSLVGFVVDFFAIAISYKLDFVIIK